VERLSALRDAYSALTTWDLPSLESSLKETAAELGAKVGELVHPARVAASGRSVGPGLYEMLEVLGKDRTLARFEKGITQGIGCLGMSNDAVVFSATDLALLARGKGPLKTLLPPVRLGIFGDPIAHSASPQMHNAALTARGIDVQYVRIRITPEELPAALKNLP